MGVAIVKEYQGFEVRSGVPIPSSIQFIPCRTPGGERIRTSIKNAKYPWDIMSIGDSFFAAAHSMKDMRAIALNRWFTCGDRFLCVDEFGPDICGVRVWRIA